MSHCGNPFCNGTLCHFYTVLIKSVYTNVNKLAVPVGYNFNCTNIFLGISEPLAPSHCFMGKISVLRKQMGHVCHFHASGYVGGVVRSRHCSSKWNFSITQWIHAMAYKPLRERV